MVKSESAFILGELQSCIDKIELMKMFWFPTYNEKFILNSNNEFFRAMRVPLTDPTKKEAEYIQATLIDTGETMYNSCNEESR